MTRHFRQSIMENGAMADGPRLAGASPRQAAIKAARAGFKIVVLREAGTNKLHIYHGWITQVAATEGVPFAKPGTILDKGHVKKIGTIVYKKRAEMREKMLEDVKAMVGASVAPA